MDMIMRKGNGNHPYIVTGLVWRAFNWMIYAFIFSILARWEAKAALHGAR
jgi:hypothetical protein